MYKYIIIQLCCNDCKRFYDICFTNDFVDTILNTIDFEDFCYYVYDYESSNFLFSIDGSSVGVVK